MRAKKSLGQNFLTSKAVAEDIIKAAELSMQDTVLEVGPGRGFLTEELLKKTGRVVAVEKDDRLIEYLQKKFAKEVTEKKLMLIHGDILDLSIDGSPTYFNLKNGDYTIVANIPYYITGQILRLFLESSTQPKKMILMVQKEVAERIVAIDGKESILSVSVKAYGTPHYIKKVPARYFNPQPKVDSAILLIDNISKNLFINNNFNNESSTSIIEKEKFFEIIKTGFAHKRKMLLNNLNVYKNIEKAFEDCNIPPKIRAEKLSVEQWVCLGKNIE